MRGPRRQTVYRIATEGVGMGLAYYLLSILVLGFGLLAWAGAHGWLRAWGVTR